MAASVPWMPFPFGPQIPVTPPPDTQSFPLPQPPPLSPQLLKSFTQELYGSGAMGGSLKAAGLQAQMLMNQRAMSGVAAGVAKPRTRAQAAAAAAAAAAATHEQIKKELEEDTSPTSVPKMPTAGGITPPMSEEPMTRTTATSTAPTATATSATNANPSTGFTTASAVPSEAAAQAAAAAKLHMQSAEATANDPRYIAMASRIAAYYHQRCQAVANFQQQRCQTWANMQRQKSQEMMQAAMLVIAWYIRDRIQRRRRRQKRQFRRGLAARSNQRAAMKAQQQRPGPSGTASGRITKGESVRKWVLQVPEGSQVLSAHAGLGGRNTLADPDEAAFDIDRDTVSDKDTRLYNVADNLIKSQLARIDVPLMGALSFDASESESEEDDDDDEGEEEEEEDYAMADYEERGQVQQETAAAVAAANAQAAGGVAAAVAPQAAARAGLGAGAREPHEPMQEDDEEDEDDDEYLMDDEDYEEDDVEVSEVVHHGTGTGVDSRQPTTTSYS